MTIPQLQHFVVRKITYTPTLTGYLVTCYTNNPCHLSLRWTSITPAKHVNPRLVRGAVVGTYIDQCFVAYTDIEQNEAGDTYTHTFTVDPWPYCETRYFYFWGTVDGNLSPSASCIFYYHSTANVLYCYRPPQWDRHRYGCTCWARSFPFRPNSSYILKHWHTHLAKIAYQNAPNTMELFIHDADSAGKPLSNLCYGSATGLVYPPWPGFVSVDITLPPTPLIKGHNYAASVRFSRDYKYTQVTFVSVDSGMPGNCDWFPSPSPGCYMAECGYDDDYICNTPPGSDVWTFNPEGGRQYFEAYGTPS